MEDDNGVTEGVWGGNGVTEGAWGGNGVTEGALGSGGKSEIFGICLFRVYRRILAEETDQTKYGED